MYCVKTIISNFISKEQRTWFDLFTLHSSNDKDIHTGIHSTASRLVVLNLGQFCPLGEHWTISGRHIFSCHRWGRVLLASPGCWEALPSAHDIPMPEKDPGQDAYSAEAENLGLDDLFCS